MATRGGLEAIQHQITVSVRLAVLDLNVTVVVIHGNARNDTSS